MSYYGRSKYRNKPKNGFHSGKESDRYDELKLMERAGMIHDLKTQQKFVLIEAQREPPTRGPKGGMKKGKLLEKECVYIADFTYYGPDGQYIVEDCKGFRTKEYVIKRKLMLKEYGVKILET